MELKNISAAKAYSDELVARIRDAIGAEFSGLEGCTVVAVGSLARREASVQSDVDYFVICKQECEPGLLESLRKTLEEMGARLPAADGAFGGVVKFGDFIEPIGGSSESNEVLTRRMLFLLESDWLLGPEYYLEVFDEVVAKYIGDKITQHQLARYFLNDLIRYYRTICVDFEYKTVGCGKTWGDRNIKLMFARKLLYFSGVLAAAQTAQSSYKFKRAELRRLLCLTPLDRIRDVCGSSADSAMKRYDEYLGWLSDESCRNLLRDTTAERAAQSDEFRTMKNAAHHFAWDLEAIFQQTYPRSHPIHQATFL